MNKNKLAILVILFVFCFSLFSYKKDSIISDCLQPLGVPFVYKFHKRRDSIKFNIIYSNAKGIEKIANICLTPSLFIFGGKKISKKEGTYQIKQACNYENHLLYKGALSFAFYPASYFFGNFFKTASYFSKKTRKKENKLKKHLKENSDFLLKNSLPTHSNEFLESLNCDTHKIKSKKIDLYITAFEKICNILDKNNIIYWLDCGTCLGAYRHSGFIPWDHDIDIGIFQKDHDLVKKLLSKIDPKIYQVEDWSSYGRPKTFLKFLVKETGSFIDIYHYKYNEEKNEIEYIFSYEKTKIPYSCKKIEMKLIIPFKVDDIFPLKKANFEKITTWVPNRTKYFLNKKYGSNLSPNMTWNGKKFVKTPNHPYWED